MTQKNSLPLLVLAVAAVFASMAPGAFASQALASKYACVACHQADKKLVGPSWTDIGTKYANGNKSAAQLAQSIKQGGSGKWGPIPMPAQPVSEAEAQTLAKWVLDHGNK